MPAHEIRPIAMIHWPAASPAVLEGSDALAEYNRLMQEQIRRFYMSDARLLKERPASTATEIKAILRRPAA